MAHKYRGFALNTALLAALTVGVAVTLWAGPAKKPSTFCNPLNLPYRFALGEPSSRELADPLIVSFKGDFYLFASMAGGYWYSKDFRDWTFVKPEGLPIESYAPGVLVLGDSMYYMAFNTPIYSTFDPKRGQWQFYSDIGKYGDPAFFVDHSGKVYLYSGCSQNGVISGVELDATEKLRPKGESIVVAKADYLHRGWEVYGDENLGAMEKGVLQLEPWVEGAWMTEHNGTYYLQYSAPGTQFRTYADGAYTSPTPKGPFTYAVNSPVSHKPSGFVTGGGHGATFQDQNGQYWRIVTVPISDKHMFERRLAIYPAGFDRDGVMHVNTVLGDYPQYFPGTRTNPVDGNLAGWMLLSYAKQATASSSLRDHPPALAFDENIRSYWSAQTGDKGEWLMTDLGKSYDVRAIQVNFAEHNTKTGSADSAVGQQYRVDVSHNGKSWRHLIDRSQNTSDVPHDYVELDRPAKARYVRITNIRTAAGGTFALRDLRVFGTGNGLTPDAVSAFSVERDSSDPRHGTAKWAWVRNAVGYIVRYGIAPDKLYNNYQVQEGTELQVNALNDDLTYYFTVDSFNENGLTRGQAVKSSAGAVRK